MDIASAILIYVLLWWVTLFAVLPIGVRGQAEENNIVHGSDPGAPVKANMRKKVIITTIVSAILFVVVYFMIVYDVFGVANS